jgi:hypothetical protein
MRGRVVGAEVEGQQLLRGFRAALLLVLERSQRDALLAAAVLGEGDLGGVRTRMLARL